jgi:hypothetical protein
MSWKMMVLRALRTRERAKEKEKGRGRGRGKGKGEALVVGKEVGRQQFQAAMEVGAMVGESPSCLHSR